jgi:hypothetical protein
MPSTCRSRPRWPLSSSRPRPRWPPGNVPAREAARFCLVLAGAMAFTEVCLR